MAVKGTFKDIAFVELLQLMAETQKTGRLEVTIDRRWAMVIFKDGQVWHVEPRGFRGASPEECVFEMIASTDGNFVFQRLQVLPSLERTVQMPTDTLILEGTKRLDDAAAAADSLGDTKQLEQVPRFLPGAEAKVRYVPQKTKQVLLAIDGKRTLKQVVQFSQMDPSDVGAVIQEMVEKGILEMAELEVLPEGHDANAPLQAHAAAAPPPAPVPMAPPPVAPPVAAPAPPPPVAPPPVAPPVAAPAPPPVAPTLTITPAAPPAPAPAPVEVAPDPQKPALRIKPGSESNLRFMPQKVKRLLGAIDGQRGVDEVIALSELSREEAMNIIHDLTSQGILEIR